MNYRRKVTSANMQTFVVPGPTFLMFAVTIPSWRRANMWPMPRQRYSQTGAEGSINLTWLDKGEIKQMKGVIPVAGGVKWGAVYQDFQSGKWIPLENAPAPELHYAGFGTPLSKDQIDRLAKPQKER
jgi:hypothetical protein